MWPRSVSGVIVNRGPPTQLTSSETRRNPDGSAFQLSYLSVTCLCRAGPLSSLIIVTVNIKIKFWSMINNPTKQTILTHAAFFFYCIHQLGFIHNITITFASFSHQRNKEDGEMKSTIKKVSFRWPVQTSLNQFGPQISAKESWERSARCFVLYVAAQWLDGELTTSSASLHQWHGKENHHANRKSLQTGFKLVNNVHLCSLSPNKY